MSPRSYVRAITSFAVALLAIQTAFSQGRGTPSTPTPTTGTGTPGTATPAPGRTPVPSTTPNTTPTPSRPVTLFVTGRVTQEDGTPPPEPAVIERVCNGSTRSEGYTDSKGYFGIEIGNEAAGVFQDASESGSFSAGLPMGSPGASNSPIASSPRGGAMSEQRFAMCDLRARLAGFRSQVVSLANRRPLDDPNIGVILLHREGKDEGSIVSAVSLGAPRDAKKAFEKGLQLTKKSKTDEAEKEYQKAVDLYPKYATAWNELGRIQMEKGQTAAAHQSFDAAVKADPKYVNPYLQLSILALEAQDWKTLAQVTDTAVKLDSFDYPQAFLFNAVANWNLKNVDAAEKSLKQAEKLDPQHRLTQVPHLMALIQAQHHDYAGAVENLKLYLKIAPNAPDADKVRAVLEQTERQVASASREEKENKQDR